MSDTAAAPVPPTTPSAPAGPRFGARSYLLAGCSVAGALCASLAANTEINYVFAIASAVFGGLMVLLTAAPSVAMPAPVATAPTVSAVTGTATAEAPAAPSRPLRAGSVGIGIVAGILSFIMNQIAQVAIGFSVFGIAGDGLSPNDMLIVSGMMGLSVLAVKAPFDLFVGAFHTSRARNIFAALGVFVLTYLFCYFIEQTISATMGMSGLFNVASAYGAEALLWGLFYVIGVPLLAQAVGAFGARLASLLTRRPG